jgi:hypothetical protein
MFHRNIVTDDITSAIVKPRRAREKNVHFLSGSVDWRQFGGTLYSEFQFQKFVHSSQHLYTHKPSRVSISFST